LNHFTFSFGSVRGFARVGFQFGTNPGNSGANRRQRGIKPVIEQEETEGTEIFFCGKKLHVAL
jgi:hypothetical protein